MFQGLRKQAISEKHRDFIAPMGGQSGPAASNLAFIHHVIMDEGRQMDHFDDHGDGDVGVVEFAQGICGQGDERRAQVFAVAIERIFGIGTDRGIEVFHLFGEPGMDGFQKRFNGFNDLFP